MDKKITIIAAVAVILVAVAAVFVLTNGNDESEEAFTDAFKDGSEISGGDYIEIDYYKNGEACGDSLTTVVEVYDDVKVKVLTEDSESYTSRIVESDALIGFVYFMGDFYGEGTSTSTETIDTYLGSKVCDVYTTSFSNGYPCSAWVDPDTMAVYKVSYVKDGVITEMVIADTSLTAGSEPGEPVDLYDVIKPFDQLVVGDYMTISKFVGDTETVTNPTVVAVDSESKTITIRGYLEDEDFVVDEAGYMLFMSTDMTDKQKKGSTIIETEFGIREVDIYSDGEMDYFVGHESTILYAKKVLDEDVGYKMSDTSMFVGGVPHQVS